MSNRDKIQGCQLGGHRRNGAQDSSGLQMLCPKCQTQNHERFAPVKHGQEPKTRGEGKAKGPACWRALWPGWVRVLAGSPQSRGSRRARKVSFDCPLMPGRGKKGWVLQGMAGTCLSKAAGLGSKSYREVRNAVLNHMEPQNRPGTELLFWSKHCRPHCAPSRGLLDHCDCQGFPFVLRNH